MYPQASMQRAKPRVHQFESIFFLYIGLRENSPPCNNTVQCYVYMYDYYVTIYENQAYVPWRACTRVTVVSLSVYPYCANCYIHLIIDKLNLS